MPEGLCLEGVGHPFSAPWQLRPGAATTSPSASMPSLRLLSWAHFEMISGSSPCQTVKAA